MMSEVMLQGVLRMPINCWSDDELSKIQRHSRYIEAADRIEALELEVKDFQTIIRDLEAEITG